MKTLLLVATLALVFVWVLDASKAIEVKYYTEKVAGVVPVRKMRYGWHPERIAPFLKALPGRVQFAVRERTERLQKRSNPSRQSEEQVPPAGFEPIRLRNGSQIYGRVIEEKDGIVWIEVEGGKVSLKKDEIAPSSR